MAAITWSDPGSHVFETGISKGVLYQSDGSGVPWNGLTGIEENIDTASEPVFYDGIKINDIVTIGDFGGTLRAFTYPDEFLAYSGFPEDQTGFYITNQPPKRFGLCYRTEVGNEIDPAAGYKLHLLYNLLAMPSKGARQTMSDAIEPIEFEWDLTATPEYIENFVPTAHVIFDSRRLDPYLLTDIEHILYGDLNNDAYLPPLQNLESFIRQWNRFVITDHNDGTWSASTPEEGVIVMLDDHTFQITVDTATMLDANKYRIWSSEKNEDDIWGGP